MKILLILFILIILFPSVNALASIEDGEIIAQRANLILPESKIWAGASKECFTTNLGTVSCFNHEIMQDLSQCFRATATGEILCIDECGGRSRPGTICTED